VRRVFWLSVGAAAGYYAARKGSVLVEEARERGVVGNVTLAAATAGKAASAASRATAAVGEAVGSKARSHAEEPSAPHARTTTSGTTPTSTSTREVRP
jgi:hypothetical protein